MDRVKEIPDVFNSSYHLRELSNKLRNPLASILGIAQLFSEEPLTSQQYSYITDIQRSGEELLAIINGLLKQTEKSKPKKTTQPKTILLVEDEPIVQTVHSAMLKKLGYAVDIAKNAEEAINMSKNSYDLIFMDVGLPDISGIQAAKKIREQQNTTPIVALTAYPLSEVKEECLAAGINEIATKPISPEHLTQIIHGLIGIEA